MASENRMRDPYAILGVSRSADLVEIKAAWREMAKKLHPDQNRSDPNAHSRFTEIGRAYDLLKDPDKRRRYDEMLNRSSFGGGAGGAGNGGSGSGSAGKSPKEQTFMERRAEKARMEAEARARAEAEARIREEAEARARMKAQAEARAKADAASAAPQGETAAPVDDEDVTPEQHEQFFEKLFGSRRQAGATGEMPGGNRRSSDRPPSEEPADAPKSESAREQPTAEPPEAAMEETAPPATAQAGADAQPTEPSGSPARGLLSYLVRRLTGQASAPEKAPEFRVEAHVSIEDLVNRINPTVHAPDGKLLTVPLPEDTMEGTTVRLEGYGYKIPGMKRGDVVATIRVKPHKWYRADHYDLRTYHDIDIENAVLGCDTSVETLDGPVKVTVPPWSGSSKTIKIEGKGLPRGGGRRGNLIVEIRVMLWDHPDQKVVDLMRSLREGLYL